MAKKQFEVDLIDTTNSNRFDDEFGFGTNPPITVSAKNKSEAREMLTLPKGIKIRKVVPVSSHARRGTSGVISHRRLKPGR